MSIDQDNKRSLERKSKREDVLIELTIQNPNGDYVDKIVSCETVDLSTLGLRLYVSECIAKGTVMDLCVRFSSGEEFFLTAELRWIKPLADKGWYFAGFEIYEGENTDYLGWAEYIKNL
ncbi:hypothetical protein A9Q99_27015 [Gammaproteobacteria bacterium 45_16_T64]|nr:hypothetical protein A9Q99_27015 [Gammaproteobacteria bacterium 45_16_T64]